MKWIKGTTVEVRPSSSRASSPESSAHAASTRSDAPIASDAAESAPEGIDSGSSSDDAAGSRAVEASSADGLHPPLVVHETVLALHEAAAALLDSAGGGGALFECRVRAASRHGWGRFSAVGHLPTATLRDFANEMAALDDQCSVDAPCKDGPVDGPSTKPVDLGPCSPLARPRAGSASVFRRIDPSEIAWDDPRKLLGSGGFGAVYRSRKGGWKGRTVAVKELHPSASRAASLGGAGATEELRGLKGEIVILSAMRHPHLIRLFGSCLVPVEDNASASGFRPFFVMEYCGGGSLHAALHKRRAPRPSSSMDSQPTNFTPSVAGHPLSPGLRMRLAVQIASAMAYLHSARPPVVHRDLKALNVLLDERWGRAKICDFGLARIRQGRELHTRAGGSFSYMAPECFKHGAVTESVDVYAFGILLNELLGGVEPWAGLDPAAITMKVALEGARPETPHDLEPELLPAADTARRCWHADPGTRPTMASAWRELSVLKAHPGVAGRPNASII
jgi:hypothetical protein